MGSNLNIRIIVVFVAVFVLGALMASEIARYPVLGVARIATVVLGFMIAYYSLEGYRKLGLKPMFYMSWGFVLLSLSILVQGVLFEFGLATIFDSMYIQTLIMAAGMTSVIYSFFCRRT